MKRILLLQLLFLCLAAPLPAEPSVEVAGHRYPGKIRAGEQSWTLRGTHHFRYKHIFSVFTGALYTTDDPAGKRLTFTYTRTLNADDLRDQAMNTLEANNPKETLAGYEAPLSELQRAYQNVKDGDSYTLTVITGRGIWLHLNETEVFFSDNSDFGYWYLDIWLGDPPISNSLKKALTQGLSS
ncbi:MAG: chalcone isomerase family protein [Kiritimatiellia bacterium]